MASRDPRDLARDLIAARIREQHATAARRLAQLRLDDARTVATPANTNSRMQLGRSIRFAESLEREWAELLDLAYGLEDVAGAVIDDGGE